MVKKLCFHRDLHKKIIVLVTFSNLFNYLSFEDCRIVGMAGIGESLLLVAFCGSCTFLTTISLSAIATNGAMKVVD